MHNTHEVISALLDNEPFDPRELADALSDPAGRALLIDLVMLRRIVQPGEPVPAMPTATTMRRYSWRLAAAAAALVLSIAGGYLAGERHAQPLPSEAPTPTRVVEAEPFVPTGGMR